jgi:CheY-like chemotaxis protein
MSAPNPQSNRRILIIDDNRAIHEAFCKILYPASKNRELEDAESALFGNEAEKPVTLDFEVVSTYQGEEGLAAVVESLQTNQPFAMAFVDVRMPPGIDGIQTTLGLWDIDPDLQVVICTAYSDYSFDEMLRTLGATDRLLVLKKPFDVIEVLQLCSTLTEKWRLSRAAEDRIEKLHAANEKLLQELGK